MKTLLLLFCFTPTFTQVNVFKTFYEKQLHFGEIKKSRYDHLVSSNVLFSYSDSTEYYLHQTINYTDQLSENFKVFLSANITTTNISNKLYNHDFYKYKTYFNSNFYFDEAYVQYKTKNLTLDVGRFIDQIGAAPFENLLVSNNDYHDGYRLSYIYKDISFSTRYFQLAPIIKNTNVDRYMVQHGVSLDLFNKKLNIQLHESAILAGINKSIPFAYLNPLLPYHANQVNDNTNSNTHYTFLTKYTFSQQSQLWFEFFLDDFQTESPSENPANNEPTEFGLILGGDYVYSEHKFLMNLIVIRNRTYNDQDEIGTDGSFSKFVDHGKIIGYKFGSNLISFRFLYQYYFNTENILTFDFFNMNYGDESVFSKFESDSYLNSSDTYFEPIPFGNLKNDISMKISYYMDLKNNFLFESGFDFGHIGSTKSKIKFFLITRYELD